MKFTVVSRPLRLHPLIRPGIVPRPLGCSHHLHISYYLMMDMLYIPEWDHVRCVNIWAKMVEWLIELRSMVRNTNIIGEQTHHGTKHETWDIMWVSFVPCASSVADARSLSWRNLQKDMSRYCQRDPSPVPVSGQNTDKVRMGKCLPLFLVEDGFPTRRLRIRSRGSRLCLNAILRLQISWINDSSFSVSDMLRISPAEQMEAVYQ